MSLQHRLGRGQRVLDGVEPRHHPLDIAVHHRRRPVEGDRGDRGGRVGPDPGQGLQPVHILGKPPAVIGGHDAGAFQQVARPGVISKPRPFPHHRAVLGRRQVADRRPERAEPFEIAAHRGHGGLLQHDLGQPHPVGIGPQPGAPRVRSDPPGQVAGVVVVPVEQPLRQVAVRHLDGDRALHLALRVVTHSL
jgi:hypothetical protein